MKVSALPKDPGISGWNSILAPQARYPVLEKPQNCDHLVIGAGFAGLAIARRLQQLNPNGNTVIVEATRIAQGPAGRNSGFMIDLPHALSAAQYSGDKQVSFKHHLKEINFNRAGIEFAAQAAEEYTMSEEIFTQGGKINAAASAKGTQQNSEYAASLNTLSEAYHFLDAEDMKSLTGSSYYRGGLFTPGAAMIQPAAFVRALATGLSRRVSIFENSPIISLKRHGSAWSARSTQACISAKHVFLAVNGHLQSFGFYKRQLMHVFTYASMSRALSPDEIKSLGGESSWACLPAHPMGSTIRRISGTGGDRIIVRNRFTYDPKMQVSKKRIDKVAKSLRRSFDARFPSLKSVEMQYTWGGRLCMSKNSVHAFGELEPGLFSACCQNGLGTAKGTAIGKLAAELAYGEQSDLLSNLQAQKEPHTLPPAPITWLGANTLMRWGEFKAGAEF